MVRILPSLLVCSKPESQISNFSFEVLTSIRQMGTVRRPVVLRLRPAAKETSRNRNRSDEYRCSREYGPDDSDEQYFYLAVHQRIIARAIEEMSRNIASK